MNKITKKLLKVRKPVVSQCNDCNHIDGKFCKLFIVPKKRWLNKSCEKFERKEKIRVKKWILKLLRKK